MTGFNNLKENGFTPHHFSGKSGGGFTLVELLVVIVIIGILLSAVVFNIRTGEASLRLQRSSHKVAQDMRKVAGLNLHAKAYTCTSGPTNFSGYGIYFEMSAPDTYIIFADCNDNQKYEPGGDEIVETLSFERRIRIQSIDPTPRFSVNFISPEPKVFISPPQSTASVTLELADDPSKIKTITINEKGVVGIN